MEQLNNIIEYLHSTSFPGKCKKTNVKVDDVEYLLKYSETETERINLCSEKFGISLCDQLHLKTSSVKLVLLDDQICLLSKRWDIGEKEQYFPLASFYEELLDVMEYVPFTYSLFKKIIIKKSPNNYDNILYTFWGLFIVDYLICNHRSAGNIGFIHDGHISLSPIFDCSTALETIYDERYMDMSFPQLLMSFDSDIQSGYNVLVTLKDKHKDVMIKRAEKLFRLESLGSASCPEEEFIKRVISFRYSKLFTK